MPSKQMSMFHSPLVNEINIEIPFSGYSPLGTYFLLVQKVGKDTLRGCPAPVALRAPGGPPPKDPFTGDALYGRQGKLSGARCLRLVAPYWCCRRCLGTERGQGPRFAPQRAHRPRPGLPGFPPCERGRGLERLARFRGGTGKTGAPKTPSAPQTGRYIRPRSPWP